MVDHAKLVANFGNCEDEDAERPLKTIEFRIEMNRNMIVRLRSGRGILKMGEERSKIIAVGSS